MAIQEAVGMMSRDPSAAQSMPQQNETQGLNVNPQEFEMALQSLTPESMATLDQHLTPPVKQAISELFGNEVAAVLEPIGPNEPTVNLPVSIVASSYPAATIEESIQMMAQDFASKGQQSIPSTPQGGLGGAPVPTEDPNQEVPPSMPMMA